MPTTIRLPGALTMPNLSRLLKIWPHDEPAIELDFRDQRWVEPAGTVALTCLVRAASNRGQEVTLTDIPHMPSKFVEFVPLSHRQGNCIPLCSHPMA